MKRLMVISALALAPLACVGGEGGAPLRFLGARALQGDTTTAAGCKPIEGQNITAGSLDLSVGANYLLALSVTTSTSSTSTSVGGTQFSGSSGDVVLNEIVYSYTSQPSIPLPAAEADLVPIYAVYPPNTDPTASFLTLNGFGPKALAQLQGAISVGQAPVTVFTTIKARGLLGGQKVETNEITFPVTVLNSGFDPSTSTCPAGTTVVPEAMLVASCRAQDIGPICR
ncbi:MAG: hypothetical protein ACXU86_04235 [Archangium sp.]